MDAEALTRPRAPRRPPVATRRRRSTGCSRACRPSTRTCRASSRRSRATSTSIARASSSTASATSPASAACSPRRSCASRSASASRASPGCRRCSATTTRSRRRRPAAYQQRIRRLVTSKRRALTPVAVAREFVAASTEGLTDLAREFDEAALSSAVGLLARAEHIYVVGVRRSYAVAAYMTYALQHIDKRVQLIDGVGGMVHEQVRSVSRDDVILAISFTPYGKETLACVRHAKERGAKSVVMTDSRMAPLARGADALLVVREGSAFAFRSLTSALCLAQALFVALAYRLELDVEETKHRGDYDA
jgi:DNA-binding MurR/RpiR family transcriptional regulator